MNNDTLSLALRQGVQGVPAGSYLVDADALRRARQGTPAGEYHVDAEALRQARQGTPSGEYHCFGCNMTQLEEEGILRQWKLSTAAEDGPGTSAAPILVDHPVAAGGGIP